MPTLEDFSKPDFIFSQKVELKAGVDPKEFLKAFTESINGASTDLGHDSRFNLGRDVSIRLLLRRTCPVAYKAVHEKYTDEEIARKPELTLGTTTMNVVAIPTGELLTAPFPLPVMYITRPFKGKRKNNRFAASPLAKGDHWSQSKGRKGKGKGGKKGKGKGKKGKGRVIFHPGAKQFFIKLLVLRWETPPACYQAAYEHSEEAFHAVCWEHNTPDICDPTESVCTYPDDGSLSFSAYLTREDETTQPGALSWDPRAGLNREHMQKWQGHCQTVNRAELTAIYMALTLDGNAGKEEVGKKLDGHQAIFNHVRSKVREAKMTGKDNAIQRMKRKLETGPEEWETKKQRITRTEAEHERRNEEPNGPEEGENAVGNTWPEEMGTQQMQEDEIELQQMQQEEEAALIPAQNTQVLQQENSGHKTQPRVEDAWGDNEEDPPGAQEDEWEVEEAELRRMQEDGTALPHKGQEEQGEPQGHQEPDHARPSTQTASQETEGAQEGQQCIALQVTQEMELPETQDMSMTAQQEVEEDLMEMAQQQEEAQEEQRELQEMAQQQATTQREAQLAHGWRRALMEKIRIAANETPEKYMQHLRGDTPMHKLSNDYWKKAPNTSTNMT
ncbi:hypothetical protein CYMTET_52837 [Cymbomonas tetramitiformis]|uniref:Uncharacterized protein n=1 Tax=Cymbomonas tetramitiformis TaxID=36881 RepID=A0AAE0EQN0_9CHLO|nr:hypothetical protein CYMTET_52837 [Cymbomonas tetramitiformis]